MTCVTNYFPSSNLNRLCIALLHHPKTNLLPCGFLNDFGMFFSDDSIPAENVLVVGDFNFHIDKPNDPDTIRFVQLYRPLGFDQFVTEPSHDKGHILDIVLS